jgi:hypothetical protein
MNKKEASKYQFMGYPVKYKGEEYRNALLHIGEIHQDIKGIHSIYRFGSVSNYGISDIDYFIVTEDSMENPTFTYAYPKNKMSKIEKYIMYHRPAAIIPKELFGSIGLFCPIFEMECIYGEDLMTKKKRAEDISKELASIFLSDAFCMLYPGTFIKILCGDKIHIRNGLTVIKKIQYLIMLFKTLGKTKNEWVNYTKRVKELREIWFEKREKGTAENELVSLLQEGISTVMDMIEEYDKYYRKNKNTKKQQEKTSTFISRKRQVMFDNIYEKNQAQHKMEQFCRKNDLFLSILPSSIMEQLAEYGNTNTIFGEYIKKYISKNSLWDKDNNLLSKKRRERSIAMSKALGYTMKIKYRAGFFGIFSLGYLDHKGYPNKVRDAFWNILQANGMKKKIRSL